MIIVLDKDLLNVDYSAREDLRIALENICLCAYRGEHLLIGDRDTLLGLAGMVDRTSASILSRIERTLAMTGSLLSRVSQFVRITTSVTTIERDGATWKVPLSMGENISRTVLIGENMTDIDIFKMAASHYQRHSKLGSIEVCIDAIPGGGSCTPDLVNEQLSRRRWVLIITDSDKKSPHGHPETVTSIKCEKLCNNTQNIARSNPLPVHEIENIIPINLAIESLKKHQLDGRINNLVDRIQACGTNFYDFADIKEGLSVKKVLSYPVGSPNRSYWINVVRNIELSGCSFADQIEDHANCPRENCICMVHEPISKSFLQHVLDFAIGPDGARAADLAANSVNYENWRTLGRLVFEWCCAGRKMRA